MWETKTARRNMERSQEFIFCEDFALRDRVKERAFTSISIADKGDLWDASALATAPLIFPLYLCLR